MRTLLREIYVRGDHKTSLQISDIKIYGFLSPYYLLAGRLICSFLEALWKIHGVMASLNMIYCSVLESLL